MTAPIFCQPPGHPRWCRLLTIGVVRHVTACRAPISADEPLLLTATEPPLDLLCSACGADLAARRQRTPTRDLGPAACELGIAAEIDVEQIEDSSAFDHLSDLREDEP